MELRGQREWMRGGGWAPVAWSQDGYCLLLLSKDQLAPPASRAGRFKLQKPEAAKIGTWTYQRLLNPLVVFLLFPTQTRKVSAGHSTGGL